MIFTQIQYKQHISIYIQLFISICIINFFSLPLRGQLIISEVVSCNQNGLIDSSGEYPDWIEIFNFSEKNIDLHDYYLSDKSLLPQKWQFPKVQLGSQSYLVLFASGKDESTLEELHTNFKIDGDGETLLLSNKDSIVNLLRVPEMACNHSYGYLPQFEDSLATFVNPTPGIANNVTHAEVSILFSHDSGFYKDSFALEINAIAEAEIRYTLNSALAPSIYSNLYTKPLNMNNRAEDENVFSEIPTADTTFWERPKEPVFKINIVRAAAFINGQQISKVYTKSYGISPLGHQRYTFPIVSLVAEPSHFFGDSTGIYVIGERKLPYWEFQLPNFNNDWERDIFVEFFETDGQKVISQDAEVEIAGQSTRTRRQKSLKLKASGKGNKNRFEYDFFKKNINRHRTLILRTTMADYRKSFIKDEMLNTLAENTGLADVDCRPVIVFLNGEYWGIHILQEKQDKYYLADYYGVDKDSLNLLQGNATVENEIIEGSGNEYLELRDYAVQHNLNELQHYNYIAEHINIDNFINYYSFHIAAATTDWPWNNIKYWRPTNQSRKWEWMPFDFDSSYNYSKSNGFRLASEPKNETVEWSVLLYNNLMENDLFKHQLLTRLEELLNNQFCTDTISVLLDHYKKKYEPEIEEHISRWNFEADYSWKDQLAIYDTFPQVSAKTLWRLAEENFAWDMMVCDTLITSINTQPLIDEDKAAFHIYPNPAVNFLNIQFRNHKKRAQLYISDITGTNILVLNDVQKNHFSIDISMLPAGIYFVYTSDKMLSALGKFIKLDTLH